MLGWLDKLRPMAIAFRHLVKTGKGDTEIVGTGLRVYTVYSLYEMGDTPERIADGYDVPLAAVMEALAYAVDNPDEMEAIYQADKKAEQRVIDRMPEAVRENARRVAEADEREYRELIRKAKVARRGAPVP